jgi:hypothetical protein
METIGIVIGALLAVAAAISTIGGAWKYIQQMKQPYEDLKNKVIQLEEQNKASKRDLNELELRLRRYIDEQNSKTDTAIHNIKEDITALRTSIEANEQDTKLILKEIFHLTSYITSGDKEKLQDLLGVNSEILNHLIDNK